MTSLLLPSLVFSEGQGLGQEGIKAAAPSCSTRCPPRRGLKLGLGALREGGGGQPRPPSADPSALLQLTLQSTKSRVAFFEEL